MKRIYHIQGMLLLGLIFMVRGVAESTQPEFRAVQDGDSYRIEIRSENKLSLVSPPEGLWSIALDWQNDWPTEWKHAKATNLERAGEWTILRGTLKTPNGSWRLSDAYRPEGNVIKCIRRFEWKGETTANRCTLSVRFQSQGRGNGVLMPGILYYGNPSGANSGRVPVYTGKPGEESIFEEHRFPMPFASLEWKDGSGYRGVALHSLPSPVPYGNVSDQWWSLGTIARDDGTEFVLLSGPCASNGKRSVIKAVQPGFVPYPDTYLNVLPDSIIEKTFYLEAFPVKEQGSGFQRPIQTSIDIFAPWPMDGMPTFNEIIQAKYRFAQTRWHEDDHSAGFMKYPDRPFYVIGWCGQAAALGYALQALADGLRDSTIDDKVQRSLDFLSKAEFFDNGFHTWYNFDKMEWSGDEPLSQGQGMLNFARAIRIGKKRGMETSRWEAFLLKASKFHASRILKDDWRPKSTAEAFFIAPLCQAYRFFGEADFLKAAEKAGHHFAGRHLTMEEPYWGGTLDASCEDKEGAFAALQGFIALYEATHEADYLKWANHACDVAITYTVVWDIDLPPGRLRDRGFKTRGWTVVSPQNQHIDVFGVLIAPDIYRLGQLLEREDYKRLALLMYRSCGQLIDPYGSQGEQPQHTNYAQRGRVDDVYALRGGYHEDWTVFWITAHFLNAAALFQDMGVEIWK